MRLLEVSLIMILLISFVYLIPAYLYIIAHPIYLIPFALGIFLITGCVFWYLQRQKVIRYQAIQKFSEVMKLDWREFEEFVAEILRQKGFHTIL